MHIDTIESIILKTTVDTNKFFKSLLEVILRPY